MDGLEDIVVYPIAFGVGVLIGELVPDSMRSLIRFVKSKMANTNTVNSKHGFSYQSSGQTEVWTTDTYTETRTVVNGNPVDVIVNKDGIFDNGDKVKNL